MSIDKFDIIIFIVCILLSIIAILFINRDKFNFNICKCCKKKDEFTPMDIFREELKNNSMEDNIKLIKNIENNKDDNELL